MQRIHFVLPKYAAILILAACFIIAPTSTLAAWKTVKISVSSTGSFANGNSREPAVSADGRYVVFISFASNLVTGDISDSSSDVFVRNLVTGVTKKISINLKLAGATYYGSYHPRISETGRYLFFVSDFYVFGRKIPILYKHDLNTGVTKALTKSGVLDYSPTFDISSDGRYLVFDSSARVFPDFSMKSLVHKYVMDTDTGKIEGINFKDVPDASGFTLYGLRVSLNGRYVAFWGQHYSGGPIQLFVYDHATQKAKVMPFSKVAIKDLRSQGLEFDMIDSASGTLVAYKTRSNILAADTNTDLDIYTYNLATGQQNLVSVSDTGYTPSCKTLNCGVGIGSSSSNGRYITFNSVGYPMLMSDPATSSLFIYRRDLNLGITRRIGVLPSPNSYDSISNEVSNDGRLQFVFVKWNRIDRCDVFAVVQ
ncbi:MAG: hypothetical protein ABL933_00510 [Methyloglobulus sp.]|nr:hypothetical protein [Methyloglobulus sp.]